MKKEYDENSHGWISVHRKIQENWIWNNLQYFQAWITILFTVNHSDKKVLIEGEVLECKRGQSLISLEGWGRLFGKKWSRQRVRTFFELLKKEQMITTEGLRKTTRLTVCNYDSYQSPQPAENQQRTSRKPQTIMNNNFNKGSIKNIEEKVDVIHYNNPITNDTR